MRSIAINGRFLTQAITGVQRHAWEVMRAMDAMLIAGELEQPAAPVEILAPPGAAIPEDFNFFQVKPVGWSRGQIWEQCSLPFFCRGRVLFTPSGGSPLLHSRHVFTLPDAGIFATPAAYSARYRAWYQRHHRWAVANPKLRLITVSHFSSSELGKWLKVSPERVTVIPLGHEHALRPTADASILDRLGLTTGKYLLCVGSSNPNKNFPSLLRAYAELRARMHHDTCPPLVVVGRFDTRIFDAEAIRGEGVIQAGYLSDSELRALYEHAACFLFPSTYEGFGLPPLEAMALGCPVISSNAASLPEVCGGAALMVDPTDIEGIVHAVQRLLRSSEERNKWITKGYQQAQQFRWRATASETWRLLLNAARD
jgi:glycosyltransferase involved in cell wall biosynthesis